MKLKSLFIFSIFAMMSLASCQMMPNLPNKNTSDKTDSVATTSEVTSTPIESESSTSNNPEYEKHKSLYGYVGTEEEFNIDKQRNTLGYKKEFNINVYRFVTDKYDGDPGYWLDLQNKDNYKAVTEKHTFKNGEAISIKEEFDEEDATFIGVYENLFENDMSPLKGKIEYKDYRAYKDVDVVLYYMSKWKVSDNTSFGRVLKPNVKYNLALSRWTQPISGPYMPEPLKDSDWSRLTYNITKKSNPNQVITIDKVNKTIMANQDGNFEITYNVGNYISSFVINYCFSERPIFTINYNGMSVMDNILPFKVDCEVKEGQSFSDEDTPIPFETYVTNGDLKIIEVETDLLAIDGVYVRSKAQKTGTAKIAIIDPHNEKQYLTITLQINEKNPNDILCLRKLGGPLPIINTTYQYRIFRHHSEEYYTNLIMDENVIDEHGSSSNVTLDKTKKEIIFLAAGTYTFNFTIYGVQCLETFMVVESI